MNFSVRIVKLYNYLKDKKKETTMSKQLLRCGTSVGANYSEAIKGISEADFLAKCYVALKEAGESQYWIELLYQTNYLTEIEYNSLNADCEELIKLLVTSIKSKKENKNSI